jgi:hypothetical protein
VSQITRFAVSREDVSLLLAELGNDHPEALYAPLLQTLLAAAATLDARAAERNARQPRTTNLLIAGEHVEAFREWLTRAEARVADNPAKAVVFARVRASRREGFPRRRG